MIISRLDEIKVNELDRFKTSTSSKGNQMKWKTGERWLKANQFGYEDIAEVASSMLLECTTLPKEAYVNYHLCKIKDKNTGITYNGCYSNDFKPDGWSLVTLHRILERFSADFDFIEGNASADDKMTYVVGFIYENIGLDITAYLSTLLTLDMVILNEDRHLNNIAFLCKDGVFDYAPIFDNGLSLLSDESDFPLHAPLDINIRRVKSKTFSSSFSKQMKNLNYGFQVDGYLLQEMMDENKAILGRAYDVLKFQMSKYKGTIVY